MLLEFVKSIRKGNFKLYAEVLKKCAPWMFILDHYNYAKLTITKLIQLHMKNFLKENSLFKNPIENFQTLTFDHKNEQMNTKTKGVLRSVIGLTENESPFQIWLICSPEITRISDEFEGTLNMTSNEVQIHHNSTISAKSSF